jgi:hypothetical protein
MRGWRDSKIDKETCQQKNVQWSVTPTVLADNFLLVRMSDVRSILFRFACAGKSALTSISSRRNTPTKVAHARLAHSLPCWVGWASFIVPKTPLLSLYARMHN